MFRKNRFLICAFVSVLFNLAAISWLGLSVGKETSAAKPAETELRPITVYHPPKLTPSAVHKQDKAKPKAITPALPKATQKRPLSPAVAAKPIAKKTDTVKAIAPPIASPKPSNPAFASPTAKTIPQKRGSRNKPGTNKTAQASGTKAEHNPPGISQSKSAQSTTSIASTGKQNKPDLQKPQGPDQGKSVSSDIRASNTTGIPTNSANENSDAPLGGNTPQSASDTTGSSTSEQQSAAGSDSKSSDAKLAEAMAQAARDNEQKLMHSGHYQPPASSPEDQPSSQTNAAPTPTSSQTHVAANPSQDMKINSTKTSVPGHQAKRSTDTQITVPPKLPMGYQPTDRPSTPGSQVASDEVKNTGVAPSLPKTQTTSQPAIKTNAGNGAPTTRTDTSATQTVIGEPSSTLASVGSHSTRGTIPDPPLPPQPEPAGLVGEYFTGDNFQQFVFKRIDANIQFDWSAMRPDVRLPDKTAYSIRWNGHVTPQYTETYTFYTAADDGVRLWIDGRQLVDNWTIHAAVENSATIALEANHRYNIRVEFFEKNGMSISTIKLYWESAHQIKEYIPSTQLSHLEPVTGI